MAKLIEQLRDFPAVEELLQSKELSRDVDKLPRPYAALLVKEAVAELKEEFKKSKKPLEEKAVYSRIKKKIGTIKRKEINKVINATGIVVHTNLGRAPLSDELFDNVKACVTGYGNIEFDVTDGKRGKRGEVAEEYLALLSGAEQGTVVNNCAAALFLILNSFANRKKVIISRSELVQIGGGFRIPDILKKSGAKLCEIGSTNITTLKDYEENIDDQTGLILKVHQSNFAQKGFVESVPIQPLVKLGAKYNVPVVNDLGSGVFIPTKKILGYDEQTVQESVRQGADLTCFSGDKMLGGAQAGLIVGRTDLVSKIKKNPLFRAMRVDKIVFSMLEKLLGYYLDNSYQENIKLWKVLTRSEAELYKVGKYILKELGNPDGLSVEATGAYVGGGALPDSTIPSVGLVLSPPHKATALIKKFREMETPIIGRIDNERFIIDLKAVDENDYEYLLNAFKKVLK